MADKPECFVGIHKVYKHLNQPIPRDVEDWCIGTKFMEIIHRQYKFQGSSFLKHKLADVTHLLPNEPFWLCQFDSPHNDENHRRWRQLDKRDLRGVLKTLQDHNMLGVVVDDYRADHPPDNFRFVDMVGSTNLAESIELLKHAEGYIGLDSCMANLACQRFDKNHLRIKAVNGHYHMWKAVYCAPHTNFDFVRTSLATPEEMMEKDKPEINTCMMTKLRLTQPRLVNMTNLPAGAIVEMPAHIAEIWIKAGIAEKHEKKVEPKKVEKKPEGVLTEKADAPAATRK